MKDITATRQDKEEMYKSINEALKFLSQTNTFQDTKYSNWLE